MQEVMGCSTKNEKGVHAGEKKTVFGEETGGEIRVVNWFQGGGVQKVFSLGGERG